MRYDVTTVEEYLDAVPTKYREAILLLHKQILCSLPKGFEVGIVGGMIQYFVPLSLYPKGYHCSPGEPLPFMALAAQKQFIALYHMGLYMDKELLDWFVGAYSETISTKLDMGKSCIRLRNPQKVPYELLGQLAEKLDPATYIELYEINHIRK